MKEKPAYLASPSLGANTQANLYEQLAGLARSFFDFEFTFSSFIEPHSSHLTVKTEFQDFLVPKQSQLIQKSLRTSQALLIPDATKDADVANDPLITTFPQLRFFFVIPIWNENNAIEGFFGCADRRPRELTPDEMVKLKMFALAGAQACKAEHRLSRQLHLENTLKSLLVCLQTAQIGHWSGNLEEDVLQWDHTLFRLFDQPEAQFEPHFKFWKTILQHAPPPDSGQANTSYEELCQLVQTKVYFKTHFTVEPRLHAQNGQRRHLSGITQVISTHETQPKKAVGLIWEDTPSVQTPLSKLMDTIADPIVIQNAAHHILFANPAAIELLEITPNDFNTDVPLSEYWTKLPTPSPLTTPNHQMRIALKNKPEKEFFLEIVKISNQTPTPSPSPTTTQQETLFVFHPALTPTPLTIAAQANQPHEIPQPKLDAHTKLESLIHGLSESFIIIMLDSQKKITYVNAHAMEVFQSAEPDLLGQDFETLFDQPENHTFFSTTWKLIDKGLTSQGDISCKKPPNSKSWLHTIVMPVDSVSVQENRILIMQHDITAFKKLEEQAPLANEYQAHVNKAKVEFLHIMSHEIRTPLNGILGMIQVLQDTPLTGEQKEYTQEVKQSGENLLATIMDLLDFSYVNSEKFTLRATDFDLNQLLTEVVATQRLTLGTKPINIQLEIPAAFDTLFIADQERIRQVVAILLGNAVKFSNRGTIKVRAKEIPSEMLNKKQIHFEVEDEGIGMTKDTVAELFQAFRQGDGGANRKYQGSGLGLSICKKILDAYEATIRVWSEPNVGSKFTVEIPLLFSSLKPQNQTQKAAEPVGANSNARQGLFLTSPVHILVAEDNVINQKVIVKQLAKLGVTADIASNGQEAIDLLDKVAYELILMDCQMPGVDGYQATAKIRSHPSFQHNSPQIPIIALTANAIPGDQEICLKAGMNDYIAKPLDVDRLTAILLKWIRPEKIGTSNVSEPTAAQPLPEALSQSKLQGLRELDIDDQPSILVELTEMFLASFPEHSALIHKAFDEKQFLEIKRIAHQLKSSSGNLGAMHLSHIAFTLEKYANWEQNPLPGLAIIQALDAEFLRVKAALLHEIKKAA